MCNVNVNDICKKECAFCACALYCMFFLLEIAAYALIITDIVTSAMIFSEYAGNWEKYCTGGIFLYKITAFALITGVIGLVSGNALNIIMLILFYAMHYNATQEDSGDCQMMDPNLYNSVLNNQKILLALLFLSIPIVLLVVIANKILCGAFCCLCCKICKEFDEI